MPNKQNFINLYYCICTENKVLTNSINYSYCSYLQMSDKGCLSQKNLTEEAIHAKMLVRSSMLLLSLSNVKSNCYKERWVCVCSKLSHDKLEHMHPRFPLIAWNFEVHFFVHQRFFITDWVFSVSLKNCQNVGSKTCESVRLYKNSLTVGRHFF